MLKILSFLIWVALVMGVGEIGYHALMSMAGKAAYAQQHDQISYSKWNRMLWGRHQRR
jgi:hypothetical protein